MLTAEGYDLAADGRGVSGVGAVVASGCDEQIPKSDILLFAFVGTVRPVVILRFVEFSLARLEEFGVGVVVNSEGFPFFGDGLEASVW